MDISERIAAMLDDFSAQLSDRIGQAFNVSLPSWVWPPTGFIGFDPIAYVALPAIGSTAVIVTFQVPKGMNGVIKKLGMNIVGAGFNEGSGALLWRVQIDSVNGNAVFARNYEAIPASLGNPANPSEIAGIPVSEGQTISFLISNVSVLVAGQLIGGRLSGWFYPRLQETDSTWLT